MKNKWCKWTPWWSCVTGAIKAMDAQYIFRIDSCYCGHSFLPYFSFSSNGALNPVPILFDCWWERLSCFRKYRDYVKGRWQTECWLASERCTECYSNDIKWFDKGFTDRFELNIFCGVISIVLCTNLYVIISLFISDYAAFAMRWCFCLWFCMKKTIAYLFCIFVLLIFQFHFIVLYIIRCKCRIRKVFVNWYVWILWNRLKYSWIRMYVIPK